MHPALVEAAEAVRRDLSAATYDQVVSAAVQQRRWWLSEWEAGAPYVLGLLAQDVQEAVHVDDPTWPLCIETSCPAVLSHALLVEPDLGADPFWTCHRTGLPVAAVGSLSG
ncbi:MAG: hypothetical protein M4D85_01520 [Actinomycetota bacterium]|nr:hypothetical protein [Actinomycetota bacterium]